MPSLLIKNLPREMHEWLKRETEKNPSFHDAAGDRSV